MGTSAQRLDAVIPIVFPFYKIKVSEPLVVGKVCLPTVNLRGRRVGGYCTERVEVFGGKIEDLGHAGVLYIRGGAPGSVGLTKYYEYGRYDAAELGEVRRIPVPDVTLGADGRTTKGSLAMVLAKVARVAGHGTYVQGAYIEAVNKFDDVHGFTTFRYSLNKVATRTKYSIWTHSCLHFMRDATARSGRPMPAVWDPTPAAYINRVRADYPDLDYDPGSHTLNIEPAEDVPEWAQPAGAATAAHHGR